MPDLVIPHADYKNLLYLGPTPEQSDWTETWESQAADYIDDMLLLLVHQQGPQGNDSFELGRGMLFFDGAAHPLPSGAIVDIIKLRLFLNLGGRTNYYPRQYIGVFEPENGAPHTPPITSDFYYDNWNDGPFAAEVNIDGLAENEYNEIELPGLMQDLAGMLRFYLILSRDINGMEPDPAKPTIIDLAGRYDMIRDHRPELVITYHLPAQAGRTNAPRRLLLGV